MIICTEKTQTWEYANIFDTETKLNYRLCYRIECPENPKLYESAVNLYVTTPDTSEGEGLLFSDQEALDFWCHLNEFAFLFVMEHDKKASKILEQWEGALKVEK